MPITAPRRAVLGWIGLACLPAPALFAQDAEEPDPTDLVPRRFSPAEFRQLSQAELYMVDLAIRRNRRIVIDGCSASDSRTIIRTAATDRTAGLQMMQARCGG